jgi:hypothetical protein
MLLRLLKHLALVMVIIFVTFALLILLQIHTPDLTVVAALITLAAAILDFIGRRQKAKTPPERGSH